MIHQRMLLSCAAGAVATAVLALTVRVAAQEAGTDNAPTIEAQTPKSDTLPTPSKQDVGGKIRPGVLIKELHIRDTDIRRALEMLNVEARKNIVTTKEVTGEVSADLYDVTFKEALQAVLAINGYVFEEKGNFIHVMTPEQRQKMLQAKRGTGVRMFRLSYLTARDADILIRPALSENATVAITPPAAMGIAASSEEAGGNTLAAADVLVVHDYEDNLRRAEKIIRDLDVRPEQVLVEATLLRARLTENNALGIDFNVLSGLDFTTLSSSSNGLQSVGTGTMNPIKVKHRAVTFRTDFNASVPQGGFTFGFLSNNVGFFVRALESITDVTVMANPKLLVMNKQRGEVMVGNKDGYLTTTFSDTIATQEVKFLETGTRLVVRPFIGRNNYVRMEIHPEDSSGAVAQVGSSALPSETTTEVTSNILVRDGHTIVIGGLFREETQTNRAQVPVLGNIPYLGALWRNTDDGTNREEVIILITPRIIRQDSDEAISEQLKDDVERFRISHRKGLRWWGRSRIAQNCLHRAKQALAKGQRGKASWYVDKALSMQPRLVEAIRIKENLTDKAYWSDGSRLSVSKYITQRMIMHELGKPAEPIILPDKPKDALLIDEDVKKAFGIQQRIEYTPGKRPPAKSPAGGDKGADKAISPETAPGEEQEGDSDQARAVSPECFQEQLLACLPDGGRQERGASGHWV